MRRKVAKKSTHWFCASGCVMLAAEHRQEEHTLDIELGRGFVAFPRGLTDWEWYTEPNTARLYFHLLLTANWSRKQWQGITIQPGQLVTSRAHLSRQLDMTENQVRSALKHLVSTGDITIKTGSKYSMITLNHYLELTSLNQRDHRQSTNQPPAGRQPLTTTLPSIPSQPEIPSASSAQTTPTAEPFSEKEGVTEGSGQAAAHTGVFAEYEANIGYLPPRCRAELAQYAEKLGDEVTAAVLHKCGDLGGRSWAYVRKALEEASALGCRTAQEYRQRAPIGGSRSAGNVRVERAEPAGDNWLIANALHRKPLDRAKKAAPPCGDAAV